MVGDNKEPLHHLEVGLPRLRHEPRSTGQPWPAVMLKAAIPGLCSGDSLSGQEAASPEVSHLLSSSIDPGELVTKAKENSME